MPANTDEVWNNWWAAYKRKVAQETRNASYYKIIDAQQEAINLQNAEAKIDRLEYVLDSYENTSETTLDMRKEGRI